MRTDWRSKVLGIAACVVVAYGVSAALRRAGVAEEVRTLAVIAIVLAISLRMDLKRAA